jgi:hypothetical protein
MPVRLNLLSGVPRDQRSAPFPSTGVARSRALGAVFDLDSKSS